MIGGTRMSAPAMVSSPRLERPVHVGNCGYHRFVEHDELIRGELVAYRREMQLEIGVRRIWPRPHEGHRKRSGRRAGPAPEQQPFGGIAETPQQSPLGVVGRLIDPIVEIDADMILEIVPNARQVASDGNAEFPERRGRPDA